MVRDESSVIASLQQLQVEEDRRRAEQVALAHRRRLEQDRVELEQQARRAEHERHLAEAAKLEALRVAEENRAEHERRDRARHLELERARSEMELRNKLTLLQTEQAHEMERLAIVRDQRVSRLEGQRVMLLGMLLTIAIGSTAIYAAVLRPAQKRQEQHFAEATRINADQRQNFGFERERLLARTEELESQVVGLKDALVEAKKNHQPENTKIRKAPLGTNSRHSKPPAVGERCVDDNDPLCGSLK